MEHTEKLSITVSPEMLQTIRASVSAGEYCSASEAVSDALRLWKQRREEDVEHLNAIRARIRRSLDDPRPDLTLEEVDAALDAAFARGERAIANGAA